MHAAKVSKHQGERLQAVVFSESGYLKPRLASGSQYSRHAELKQTQNVENKKVYCSVKNFTLTLRIDTQAVARTKYNRTAKTYNRKYFGQY